MTDLRLYRFQCEYLPGTQICTCFIPGIFIKSNFTSRCISDIFNTERCTLNLHNLCDDTPIMLGYVISIKACVYHIGSLNPLTELMNFKSSNAV